MQNLKNKKLGRQVLPEQKKVPQNTPIFIPLFFADPTQKRQIVWEIELCDGQRLSGKASRNRINLPYLPNGSHNLTVIVGQNLLSKSYKIYKCELVVLGCNGQNS